ncbi:hypothetical protein GCM10010988_32640 [Cnuibacter physcomitrellae]|uniref:Uncharacterized protein n=1 Tax=Cnuibacter physcomitrellae TaxID=1619308 RepID=A0A1X9LJK5_9MICO|nr:hypothetical protein [Cnuibacter physcomitrellae]ARJ04478.1 hypothetical protein B5808_03990 [Cnuibacter physcomitrellae]GGI41148.1 hypothetical protein GCM10010988_32640 [Cnuibacter physcomitrellae]
MSDEPRHPGYGPTPPGGQAPQPGQPWPPQQQAPQPPQGQQPGQPSYQQPPRHPGYGQQPGPGHDQQSRHPGYGPTVSGPGGSYGPGSGKPRNTLGLVAVILAGVAVLTGFLFSLIQASFVYSIGSGFYGVLAGLTAVIHGLLGVGAVVFGILGLRRREGGVVLAALGLGAGAVIVVETLSSLLYPLLAQITYDYGY